MKTLLFSKYKRDRKGRINKRMPRLFRALIPGLLAVSGFATEARADLIAIGRVSTTGILSREASPIGAGFVVNKGGDGEYEILLHASGAFAGTSGTDYIVNLTTSDVGSDDEMALANVSVTSDDEISIDVRMEDLEDAVAPNSPQPRNRAFYFQVYRIPGDNFVSPDSNLVFATGLVDTGGNIVSAVAAEGGSVTASRPATGEYEITVSDPGAFSADDAQDYVIACSVDLASHSDEAIRAGIASVASDDEVVFQVNTDDVQSTADDDNHDPASRSFSFVIYRVPQPGEDMVSASQLLVGMARVNGASGFLQASASGLENGSVVSGRQGEGDYTVTITAPGQFAGKQFGDYAALVQCYSAVHDDEIPTARAIVQDDDTLIVHVTTSDVEVDGTNAATPQDRNFSILVLETFSDAQPDMLIGRKRSYSKMKGKDRYNTNGRGQRIRLKVKPGKRTKSFFRLENDGNIQDDLLARRKGSWRRVKPKIYCLTGGKRNVTGKMKSSGFIGTELKPGEHLLFQSRMKFRGSSTASRTKVRFQGLSTRDLSRRDVIMLRLKRKN